MWEPTVESSTVSPLVALDHPCVLMQSQSVVSSLVLEVVQVVTPSHDINLASLAS